MTDAGHDLKELFRSTEGPWEGLSALEAKVRWMSPSALAAQSLMLALSAEGWDSCPMEGFDPWRARKLLGLGRGAEVCMFLAVGKRGPKGIWWERTLMPEDWMVRSI